MTNRIAIFCQDQESETSLAQILSGREVELVMLNNHVDLILHLLEHDCQAAIYGLELPLDMGLKIVQILRKIRPKLPLIVVSDEIKDGIGGKILQEGVSYYTLRPVSPERLNEVMETVLH